MDASWQFVSFGLMVAILSNLKPSPLWRAGVLLAASLVFIGLVAQSVMGLLPLSGFLLLGYAGLLERGRPRATRWFIVAVLLVYAWLKKYSVFPQSLTIQETYFTLGLSYIFFRVLQLLIETGDRDEKQQVGFFAYLLYMLNFTTLVSGPIQSYDAFARDQFSSQPPALGPRVIGLQLERIVRGLFKVNVLALLFEILRADALTQLCEPLPLELRAFAAFKLAVAYPLFLYANFSGYIDIVIALARLMRVRLPENFDRPFSASSVLEFWNRWHITLSIWLKTYVYNPLLLVLMRRVSAPCFQAPIVILCYFVTFFLVGIWHGRTSEFIVFGVLTGAGVSINKLWQLGAARVAGRRRYKVLAARPVYITLARGLNFSWFAFTLLWFWADWQQIRTVVSALRPIQWVGEWLAVWLCSAMFLGLWERVRALLLAIRTTEGPVFVSRYARVVYASALGVASLVMTVLLNQPAPAVVYKAF
jgi:alginate O-acetyltransferase complex protein AlgI